MRKTGFYEFLGALEFFIPHALPPKDSPFQMDAELISLYGDAMHHLGKLNEMTKRLVGVERFIKAYVYKEALLSSEIEGIHTTLLDVYTQPFLERKADKDTQLVMNYTRSLYASMSMIRDDGFPIVERVIRNAHKTLMVGGDGDRFGPGNYRKQVVRVRNLVPPPSDKIPELMSALERYINKEDDIPPLIKSGLVHVQFETIHPFLDGNGRIGRLLIVLMLVKSGMLLEPILYPSYYFKKRSLDYYKALDEVRVSGDFESWIKYYLTVIKDSCIDATRRAEDIEAFSLRIKKCIGASQEKKLQAFSIICKHPIINIKTLSESLRVSYNTAKKIILDFVTKGILVEEIKRKRDRLFTCKAYLEILEKEYD